jgi:hypothetical protein
MIVADFIVVKAYKELPEIPQVLLMGEYSVKFSDRELRRHRLSL